MRKMRKFRRSLSRLFLCNIALFVMLTSTGCSFGGSHDKKNINDNVAYAVPEKVAANGVEVRRRPTRPAWTEDRISSEDEDLGQSSGAVSEIYIVQKGDTIYGISRKFGVPARELMSLNGFTNQSRLSVGQKIQIPARFTGTKEAVERPGARNTIIYTVKRGDSFYKIAQRYGMTVPELKKLNNATSDTIYVGQKVKVYGASGSQDIVIEPHVVREAAVAQSSGQMTKIDHVFVLDSDGCYTIQPGDTLERIAHEFHVSLKYLRAANGITDPTKLQIGKKLIIPNEHPNFTRSEGVAHVVAPETNLSNNDIVTSMRDEKSQPVVNRKSVEQSLPSSEEEPSSPDDFFENFDEIPVVEINN